MDHLRLQVEGIYLPFGQIQMAHIGCLVDLQAPEQNMQICGNGQRIYINGLLSALRVSIKELYMPDSVKEGLLQEQEV